MQYPQYGGTQMGGQPSSHVDGGNLGGQNNYDQNDGMMQIAQNF